MVVQLTLEPWSPSEDKWVWSPHLFNHSLQLCVPIWVHTGRNIAPEVDHFIVRITWRLKYPKEFTELLGIEPSQVTTNKTRTKTTRGNFCHFVSHCYDLCCLYILGKWLGSEPCHRLVTSNCLFLCLDPWRVSKCFELFQWYYACWYWYLVARDTAPSRPW